MILGKPRMINNFMYKVKRTCLFILAALSLCIFAPLVPAYAQNSQSSVCGGANTLQISSSPPDQGDNCSSIGNNPSNKVNILIKDGVNLFSAVIGTVSVIMVLVGGFRYITSGGSSEKVSGAKNTILYAVIGLVVVGVAQILVQFVLNKVHKVG
jgi:TRAP-type C4-dicarboxylate transport system permease small subunit